MLFVIEFFCERENDLKELYAINDNDMCFCVEKDMYIIILESFFFFLMILAC